MEEYCFKEEIKTRYVKNPMNGKMQKIYVELFLVSL